MIPCIASLTVVATAVGAVVTALAALVKVWVNKTKNNNTDEMKARDRSKKIAAIKTSVRKDFDEGNVANIEKGTSK